ncbi:lipopolysaccharide export LptBFGC system permease protein LptF [Saonia flava]|uniref:Lipopolysaccharide export LptBFGC system permease protein LptF n=1 Tax=Saonia flava TaxID=523696 RepID=A0A846QU04_9FLAO|nr:hypothetical protein [Saonia flava]NJB69813.1 lipopolysaccharide export LptBFGC system permease protein LptF [Saonia flava]
MKYLKLITIATFILGTTVISAQEKSKETVQETTKKTYKLYKDGKLIKNSVLVNTKISQPILTDDADKKKVNQTRVFPNKKKVTKTVRIDNDKDDKYDEKIVFSYMTDSISDFVLVSDIDEIIVAVEDGSNLEILENITLKSKANNKKVYVFTDGKGKEVELFVESHTSIK